MAFIFFGTTASGKSFLARKWSASHHFAYLNTDVIRKQLAHKTMQGSVVDNAIEGGIYTREFSRMTYDSLLDQAEEVLKAPKTKAVVVDGSYIRKVERDRIRKRLSPLAGCIFIQCICSENVVRERLSLRAGDQEAVSDGTWEVYLHQQKILEPPDELPARSLLTINTEQPVEMLTEKLDEMLLSYARQ